jgi:hypothetical protein
VNKIIDHKVIWTIVNLLGTKQFVQNITNSFNENGQGVVLYQPKKKIVTVWCHISMRLPVDKLTDPV